LQVGSWEYWEDIFKISTPNFKPITRNRRRMKKYMFFRPRPRNHPICEFVRNWLIFFGEKAQLMS
jgi:hypothetical protein